MIDIHDLTDGDIVRNCKSNLAYVVHCQDGNADTLLVRRHRRVGRSH